MTGEMPAAHLARLRVTYPLYRIEFVTGSFGFAARRDGCPDLWAQTLPQLEDKLRPRLRVLEGGRQRQRRADQLAEFADWLYQWYGRVPPEKWPPPETWPVPPSCG
jgi:hypothetical protein